MISNDVLYHVQLYFLQSSSGTVVHQQQIFRVIYGHGFAYLEGGLAARWRWGWGFYTSVPRSTCLIIHPWQYYMISWALCNSFWFASYLCFFYEWISLFWSTSALCAPIWTGTMLHVLYAHPCSFYSLYFGLSGGVEACNNDWQHEMNALSMVEEAKAGTTMSRCTRKMCLRLPLLNLLFFDKTTFSPQLSLKTFCYILAFLYSGVSTPSGFFFFFNKLKMCMRADQTPGYPM